MRMNEMVSMRMNEMVSQRCRNHEENGEDVVVVMLKNNKSESDK
jgi:hypothetical protein